LINEKEISNLIYLLDDNDVEVIEQIEEKILSLGVEAISFLEEASKSESEAIRLQRMQLLIRKLKRFKIQHELERWKISEEQDLLQGMLILERIEFPYTDVQGIHNQLDKIKLDAWLELNYDLTSFEQVKILNYIFFQVHKFSGNTESYHHAHNSFISKVLEDKKGNPVSMAIVYSLIAQRLNIPVFGVNLPQHFILGYQSEEGVDIIRRLNDPGIIGGPEEGDIMFYINPFSEGLILNHDSLRSFLKQLNIEARPEYFKVCTNVEILQRVLRNLVYSYEKSEEQDKVELIQSLMEALSSDS
jgi:regulator of sirC expression with transglutaminase-like and TPR domain